MPQSNSSPFAGLSHGSLYCLASLILGIELNIVGPTVDSLAAQVGATEAALGGVVGLGGIGLLLGGLPAGWLLDRLPGHTVLTSALVLQAVTFFLLPHCAHLAVLAATYCAAALTFNAITTGANALILWRYPASQGAWLNLASALFGVGCFLAPVLADLASRGGGERGGGGQGHDSDAGGTDGYGVGDGTPFSLRGGPAALAYYAVAAGAATCAIWAASLPSPQRPEPHHHHHHQHQNEDGAVGEGRQSLTQRVKPQRAAASGKSSSSSGRASSGSFQEIRSSPSFASVLDLGGLESSTGIFDTGVDALGAPPASAAEGSAAWGTSSTTSPDGVTASPIAQLSAADLAAASNACLAAQDPSTGTESKSMLPATLMCDGHSNSGGIGGGGSISGTEGGFGSALSTSPTAWDETGSGSPDQNGEEPVFGAAATASTAGADTGLPAAVSGSVSGGGSARAAQLHNTASDILSAAAAQIKLLQGQREQQQRFGADGASMNPPGGWWRGDRVPSAAAADSQFEVEGNGGEEVGSGGGPLAAAASTTSPPPPLSPTAALFRRYLHELRMGWPVLLPVVILLFANISTQASFGAWVTTYCQRAAGLDEATAHAVTAAYWAAFTGTRMAAVAAAPFLHASRVLLITSPFAVAGAGLAVMGLPKISWLFPHAAATAEATAAAAAAAGGGDGTALADSLPVWALYTAVCLVGVGVSTGFANTVSLTGDHLQLDGFTNGILSSVAGLASTLCPAAVPWLAAHTRLGYGALMAVALAMSGVQLAMVVAALIGARWVDEWQRLEEEEEGE
ncbi:hypothetical protein Vretifemale_6767, partial [Volvox reticuliferus]